MAWTAPKTWTAAVVTVGEMNTHLRDNLLFLKGEVDAPALAIAAFSGYGSVDLDVSIATDTLVLFTGTIVSDYTASGLLGGVAGRLVIFKHQGGAFNLIFNHNSGAVVASHRFVNLVTSGPTVVGPGGSIAYVHNGTNWQYLWHEQGAWITPQYVGAHFNANGAMTWTVDSGDVVTSKWRLSGKQLTYEYYLSTTTIGGTPSTVLQINNGQWGGYTIGATSTSTIGYANDGALNQAHMQANSGATLLGLNRVAGSAWAAITNGGIFQGITTFEVQ